MRRPHILAILLALAFSAVLGGAAFAAAGGGGPVHLSIVPGGGGRPGALLHLDSAAQGAATVGADVDFSRGVGAHTEVWLAALAQSVEERSGAVVLRLSKESGFFARWRLNVAAPPGILPAEHISGVDEGLE